MTTNLHQTHKVGDFINFQRGVYRISGETGMRYDMLPGGAGVREVELEFVQWGTLTNKELRELTKPSNLKEQTNEPVQA